MWSISSLLIPVFQYSNIPIFQYSLIPSLHGRAQRDLRPDAFVGEALEHKGVRDAAIDHMHLAHAASQRVERAVGLWNHSSGDNAFLLEPGDRLLVQRRNQRAVVLG